MVNKEVKHTYKNGLRLIMEPVMEVGSVCIGVWINAGAVFESKKNNGVSHFLEHLLFKGTEKRSAFDIAESIDAVGGQINAFSSKEFTCYFVKVRDEHCNLAMEVLSDMIKNSAFDAEEIEKERNVIIEEIKMYEDAPDEIIHDIFTQSLFQSSPIGYPILGSREIIGNLPRQEILKYYKKMYTAPNIVVSMSGNFKTDTIIQEVGELFGDIRSGKGEIINKYRPDATYSTIIRQKDIEQVHLITGTMASPEIDIDRYKISLLSTILGGGMSSRLFQKIREERGLAYSVFSYTNRFRHAGLFAVYAGCAEAEAPYVLELILQELQELRENIVPSRELDRAKEQMKGGIILGLESTNARMNRLGRNEIYFHKQIPIDEILQKISNVTPEDIQEMAQRYFYQERLAMTVIGPSDDQEPFLEKLNILENE